MTLFALALIVGGGYLAYQVLTSQYQPPVPEIVQPNSSPIVVIKPGINPSEVEDDEPTTNPSFPQETPDFRVYDNRGLPVKLSDQLGKPVVVSFWATWCPYCIGEFDAYQKLYNEFGDEVVFMMVDLPGINGETAEAARTYIHEHGYTFPVYFDFDFSAYLAYSATAIPLSLFIDSDGYVVKNQLGAVNEATLRSFVNAIR